MEQKKDAFNVTELAKGFDLNREQVAQRLAAAGIQPLMKGREKLYFLEDVEKYLTPDEADDLEEAKLRKLTAEANLKELELKVKNGEFGAIAEFAELTHQWVGWLYAKFDKKFPDIIVGKVAKTKSKAEAIAVVRRETQAIFNEFRANPRKFLNGK